ncbi:MAG: YbaK/EbsC family protein [Chloroflexi bacterium]|nr:MAG: YbaK/EbsC family protein [Chloroflexota bacterium]
MHPSAQRVQNVLTELGYFGQVIEHAASTRTAVEAAQAAGCEVGQIVKSLVFRLQPANEPVLVLVSGPNRVHEKHFGQRLGGTLERADADYVHEISGYAIGGVPPVGHKTPLKTYVDEDLLQYETVWAAAGTPNAVFEVSPPELVRISEGQVVNVK